MIFVAVFEFTRPIAGFFLTRSDRHRCISKAPASRYDAIRQLAVGLAPSRNSPRAARGHVVNVPTTRVAAHPIVGRSLSSIPLNPDSGRNPTLRLTVRRRFTRMLVPKSFRRLIARTLDDSQDLNRIRFSVHVDHMFHLPRARALRTADIPVNGTDFDQGLGT